MRGHAKAVLQSNAPQDETQKYFTHNGTYEFLISCIKVRAKLFYSCFNGEPWIRCCMLIIPEIKFTRGYIMAFPILRQRAQASDHAAYTPTFLPGSKRCDIKAKHCKYEHVAPHVTGKSWIFSVFKEALRGAEGLGWMALLHDRGPNFHR